MAIQMKVEQVKTILKLNDYKIESEARTGNNLGTTLKVSNGCVINCWDTGTVNLQGKNTEEIKALLEENNILSNTSNRKVFVVYGHDNDARDQLELMLRRWKFEPLILDQLTSSGQTVIEKLEEFTNQANCGIVLATPDDVGYPKDDENKKRYRVRQNVVLELGMLLSKIGRKKVAILLSQAEDMERPSDIDGLIYIPFKKEVEEATVPLIRQMGEFGYKIETGSL